MHTEQIIRNELAKAMDRIQEKLNSRARMRVVYGYDLVSDEIRCVVTMYIRRD